MSRVFENDDTAINRKVRAVLAHNMKPILCIGESKSEYDAGLVKSVRYLTVPPTPHPQPFRKKGNCRKMKTIHCSEPGGGRGLFSLLLLALFFSVLCHSSAGGY